MHYMFAVDNFYHYILGMRKPYCHAGTSAGPSIFLPSEGSRK